MTAPTPAAALDALVHATPAGQVVGVWLPATQPGQSPVCAYLPGEDRYQDKGRFLLDRNANLTWSQTCKLLQGRKPFHDRWAVLPVNDRGASPASVLAFVTTNIPRG